MTVLIALDIDWTINLGSSAPKTGHVDEILVGWDPTTIARLNALAAREDIALGWLTDWAKYPAQLETFERLVGAGVWLKPHGAAHDPTLTTNSFSTTWWKHAGLLELIQMAGADRAVWVDDNHERTLPESYDRWLLGVHPDRGLDAAALDRIEAWLERVS